MDAMKHNRFDVARMTLQTLINTYPDSEFIARRSWRWAIPGTRKAGRRRWRSRAGISRFRDVLPQHAGSG